MLQANGFKNKQKLWLSTSRFPPTRAAAPKDITFWAMLSFVMKPMLNALAIIFFYYDLPDATEAGRALDTTLEV